MQKAINLALKPLLLSVLLITILQFGISNAQVIGVSHIVMVQNSSSIYQNSSLAIPFSVNLTSGSAGQVDLVINNSDPLQLKGIFLGLNKSTGIPNFNDTLFINTNFDSIAVPGKYTIEISAGGSDPLNPEFTNFTLTVLNTTKPTTTIQAVSPTGSNSTTQAVSTGATEKDIGIVFGVAIVVIIILLIIDKIRS